MAKPTNLPEDDGKPRGLTIGTTVGIGVGVAVVVILIAIGSWIFVRRRRRRWANKRKKQGDPEFKGDTPDEEIAKKVGENEVQDAKTKEMRAGEMVEIADGEMKRAELVGDEGKKDGAAGMRSIKELHTENNAHELPTTSNEPREVDEKVFIAELDGTSVPAKVDNDV